MMTFNQIHNDRIALLDPILQLIVRRALRISSRRLDGGVMFDIVEQEGVKTEIKIEPLFEGKKKITEAQMTYAYHIIATCMLQAAMEQRAYLLWGGNSQLRLENNKFVLKK
jgi:hypothetical protein